MRIMGLDFGSKTVGVAISDALLITAQGVEIIRRKEENKLRQTLARIEELIAQYEVEKIVLGKPKHMNGTEGERCEIVRAFAEEIQKTRPDAEIIFWDERLSTVAAARSLISADVSRKKRKKVIDKMAAVFILQGYLDSLAK